MGTNIKPNSYSIGDAVEFVKLFKGSGFSICTSPPYNKGMQGKNFGPNSKWKNSKLINDGYDMHSDKMNHSDYVAWQREFLTACMDCIGDNGIIMYNTGRRFKNFIEDRRQEIMDGFPIRQQIIWNYGSTLALGGNDPCYFPPIYELIYVIAGKNWRLPKKYLNEMMKWGDIWRINRERGNPHPAPFPLELAIRMVKTADNTVLDPFAGSGTIGMAAMEVGVDYYLNDISPAYKQMFENRKIEYDRKISLFE